MLYTQHIPCICIYLDISSPKFMALHVEWVTTGAHNPAIQVWLGLNSLEGVDVVSLPVRYEACRQNSIVCHCTPMFPTLIVYRGYQNQPHRVDLARCQMCLEREACLVDGSLEILKKRWFMLYQHVYRGYIHVYTWYIHGIYHVYQRHMEM